MTHIGLLGATGYTGRLTAAELAGRGITARLGGRDPDRLGLLPTGPDAEPFVVDTTQPKRLAAFLDGLDAVISCVGPFVRYGDPVVDAAVEAGVPYVDSTGETAFMTGVYDRHADAPVAVVPASGFDFVIGDLATAIAADEVGNGVTDVVVGYQYRGGGTSRGTMRSAVGMIERSRPTPYRLRIGFPDRERSAVQIPWGEEVTVPRRLPGARVRSGLVVGDRLAQALHLTAPAMPYLSSLGRFAVPLLERYAERQPEGPSPQTRARGSFRVLAQASSPSRTARVLVTGGDAYELTAHAMVDAALAIAAPGAPTGALTPAQAFPWRPFLDGIAGVSWQLL